MKIADFDYVFPKELVAQHPIPKRDQARMMVVSRCTDDFQHNCVANLPSFLQGGDVLVVNDSKVFPARLFGRKKSGSKIEILLLRECHAGKNVWFAMTTRKKRTKKGDTIYFDKGLSAEVLENRDEGLTIKFDKEQDIHGLLEEIGLPPLPPYIHRKTREDYSHEDRERYQTVYARHVGSAAAPTAGFHLTEEVLKECGSKGVEIAAVTLHVGLDTFSPVRVENIKGHKMHGEAYFISNESWRAVSRAKKEGRRIIAVGTTTVRALESAVNTLHFARGGSGRGGYLLRSTHLFIYPGYKFKMVDAMLTNFHQPRSTLLMLVSAFAGRKFVLDMYAEAIKEGYRLFSYGDCMLIF